MKRVFDLIVANLALIVLAPILFVIAVWIKVNSPGPVLFSQIRVGRYGREFVLWKFRTMYVASDKEGRPITCADDDRITGVGQYLRKWKLDELPQLWNIVIGDMSIVGPRPEVKKYVALYPSGSRERILSVRPGLTDFAAIQFRNESLLLCGPDPEMVYREEILPQKIALYERYIDQQSILTDLHIIASTIRVIFFPGALQSDH